MDAPPIAGAMSGIAWPAVPLDAGAQLLAMQFQFERSEWWSPAQLAEAQDRQLDSLLQHALETVPFYRERWAAAGIDLRRPASADFYRLPILTRGDVQIRLNDLLSIRPPLQHGPLHDEQTSGSLGMPVRYRVTQLHGFYWHAITLRDHLWHGRDFSAKLAAIRYTADGSQRAGWGGMLDSAIKTGSSATLSPKASTSEQLRWLLAEAPAYLITYPSILRALARQCIETATPLPSLREVRSFGEVVSDETRALIERTWGVPLVDTYSAQETGYLALQCPAAGSAADGPNYHAMAETVRLEVLDDQGRPCQPGQVGRVVVTPLHNFAMPLIRYAIGDYAEVGAPCSCGRGLPTLKRIVGRQRNLIRLPDGQGIWPVFGTADWIDEIPVRQLRLVQRQHGVLIMEYVMDRPLAAIEVQRIAAALQTRLPVIFDIRFERRDALSPGPSGKFEDVLCNID